MTSPADERARKIVQALQHPDLDALMPLMAGVWPTSNTQVHSLLRHIFTQAGEEQINLLHPPEDFHAWLLAAAQRNVGPAPASSNTVRLRLALLSKLYTALQDQGLLLIHPLRGLQRPPNERLSTPLLPKADLKRLHLQAQSDAVLYAALILIDQHAYRVKDLLNLHWQDFDLATGSTLRPHAVTRLSDVALTALKPLLLAAGGELYAAGRVLPYAGDRELRGALFQACKAANVPYTPPGELRKISLRDYRHTPQSAGFSADDARKFAQATALARGVAEALKEG
ncbi:tyrosine-type recombinase/integrase [Deinococcus marmoris]|uniref:Uncharacterized protein n=1 Tax=Deinococcus marmoris TaxID=249408 RepID=A0A1U7NZ57_9DEIO|nr:site-specific integrase [Deinococcus marmoris]OLV18203.1 hypothetical protein BOO71_0006517 [Deinococcus marmoris]